MPTRTLGGIARSSQSAIPVLRAEQCDVAVDPRITFSRASGGTRFESTGAQTLMGTNVPRIDRDPVTLAVLGFLIEGAGTNVLTKSEDWTTPAGLFLATASTVTPATYGKCSTRITFSAGGLTVQYAALSVAASQAVQARVKAGTLGSVVLALRSQSQAIGIQYTVNLSNGALTDSSYGAPASKIAPTARLAPGGEWLVQFGGVLNSGGGVETIGAYALSASAGTADIGAGMLETADAPSSYIPTAGASATRDADAPTITGAAFTALHNAAAWGAFLRFHIPFAVGTRPILSFDDGTANNRIEVYASGTSLKLRVVTGGAQQCDTTIGTIAANTTYKLAISQEGGAFLSTLNGAAEVSATAASMPTVDRARLGHNQAGNYLNGHLHTWDAYLRPLPVRERLELTA